MTLRRSAIGAIVALALIAVFARRMSGSMADFEVYWRGAVRAAAAEPLYRADDAHYRFKYFPAFAVLTIPVGNMPLSVAKAAWFTASIAFLVSLVAVSLRLLPERRASTAFVVAAVILVLGKFFAHELVLGQVNTLFALLAACAFLAMRHGWERSAGVLIAFTIAIKPYGVLFVPWLLARRKAGSIVAVCLTFAAIGLLPVPLYGMSGTIDLYRAWWATVTETTPSNLLNPDNVSLASMYAKWIGAGASATALTVLTALAALAAVALAFSRRRAVHVPDALEGSLLLTLVPLLSPQGWDYVLLLAAPGIALLANEGDRLPATVRTAAIVAGLTMGLSLFDLLGRQNYAAFMGAAVISVCALVLFAAMCVLRVKKIA